MRALLLSTIAFAAACGSRGSSVLVTIESNAGTISGIARTHASITALGRTETFDRDSTASPVSTPYTMGIDLPPGASGTITVNVDTFDIHNAPLASGSGSTSIVSGGVADLTVTLLGQVAPPDLLAVDSTTFDLATDGPPPDLVHVFAWTPMSSSSSANLHAIAGLSASSIYAVGDSGTIIHYDGAAWSPQTSMTTQPLYDVATGLMLQELFAVGGSGTIVHTTDSGTTWGTLNSTTTQTLYGVFTSSTSILAVGTSGTMVGAAQFAENSWSAKNTTATGTLHGIWDNGSGDVFVAGASGAIYHAPDWVSFTPQTSGTSAFLYRMFGTSTNNVFIVGDAGTILHTANGGSTWTPRTSGTTETLLSIWCAAGDCYAVGAIGTILHSIDAGVTWTPMSSGTTANLNGVWGDGAGVIYAVGDGGTVLRGSF